MKVQGSTRVYGIIGQPVTHSLSPIFQDFFAQNSSLDTAYLPFPTASDSLEVALQGLRLAGVQGLNITIPHKEAAFNYAYCDAAAKQIGAINTLKNDGCKWLGTNTDYIGIKSTLTGLQADTTNTLLFGAGGTARAAIHALADRGTKQLTIINRTRQKAEALQSHAAQHYPDLHCKVSSWNQTDVDDACKHHKTLINCSSVGLNDRDVFPFHLSGQGVAMDAVYQKSGSTAFCRAASASHNCCDGLPLLIAQGAASFAWWHNTTYPDKLSCLRWMEQYLSRSTQPLPGWMESV